MAEQPRKRKSQEVLFWIAVALIAGVFGFFVLLVVAPRPGAPVGASTIVTAMSVYVRDDGARVSQDGRQLGVDGVQISLDDGRGDVRTIVTATPPGGPPPYVQLDVRSGYTYTITASFNDDTLSTEATMRAYRKGYFQTGTTAAGWLVVNIRLSDGEIHSIRYDPGAFL